MRKPAIASERVTTALCIDTIVGEEHAFLPRTRWRRGSQACGNSRIAIIAAVCSFGRQASTGRASAVSATPRGRACRLYTESAMNDSGLSRTTIGIIGTGVMAESIFAGILHEDMSHPECINVLSSPCRAA